MFLKESSPAVKSAVLLIGVALGVGFFVYVTRSNQTETEPPPAPARVPRKPDHVRGIHLTAWIAGSKKARERIASLLEETELNTLVIAVKEYEGQVYIPGVPFADKHKLAVNAVPDIADYLAQLHARGIYAVARIVVFKDDNLARRRPDLAVKRPDGSLWTDHRKIAWADPYSKEVWRYNFAIASRAVALGFDEIQFDYIRFPSDGDVKQCRYSYAHHNASSAVQNLDNFLEAAAKELKPLGAHLSIDIFGLTTSVTHDMGIGQKITDMTRWVDYVSPMVYPSHYAKGEYGIPDPNREPYRVVHKSMYAAKERLAQDYVKLRPYLQDFSLGYGYGPREVRAQIEACEDLGIKDWLLWDPNCRYTKAALKSKRGVLSEVARVPENMIGKSEKSKSAAAKEAAGAAPQMSTPTPVKNTSEEKKKDDKE